ncbi:hypothetical protein BO71DRAFT_378300, partial [Aspergillus ellipticus CBS 707.79]
MESLPTRIARLVHTHFDGLPPRSKPIVRDDGTREWIPMSGVVVVRGENTPVEELTCVAVTSGAKCLSAAQIPHCKGLVLHDWHAEILALRAFNYWLLGEVRAVVEMENNSSTSAAAATAGDSTTRKKSPFVRRRQQQRQRIPRSTTDLNPNPDTETATETQTQTETEESTPFELHPALKIYMYCTCAPCGDASMELTMAAQDDPTPWEIPEQSDTDKQPPQPPSETQPHPPPPPDPETETESKLLDGRAHFSKLGIVRRKPARADASSTKSKSCSDKLALRQVSSLISREMGLLVAVTRNAYLAGVVMPS